jgi:hypothetical protein
MRKEFLNAFSILILILLYPFSIFSQEIYEYERMWPILGQPWYFNAPRGIAIDRSGNVFVADTNNDRIQKLTPNGQLITKWGSHGSENGQFWGPSAIAIDSGGYVYVADTYNSRIQKFTSNGEFVKSWGGFGRGDGEFMFPGGIALDASGNLYVADSGDCRIQKFTSDGQFVTKWGSYGSEDGQFVWLAGLAIGVAIDGRGDVYVADTYNDRVQKFTSNGQFISKWGRSGDGDGEFSMPKGIATDASGNVYVADAFNGRIQKFTGSGEFIMKWGNLGRGDGEFLLPAAIAISSGGNIYVADLSGGRIQKLTSEGQFTAKWWSGGIGEGQFDSPQGIAIDSSGNLYVADTYNDRVQKFASNGQFISEWGRSRLFAPSDIAIDGSGSIYVADDLNSLIQKFASNGQFITNWGSSGDGDGQLNLPSGIAVDVNANVYVADTWNHRIQKFTSDGQFITKWGSQGTGDGQFDWPSGVAIDGRGDVYVADTNNNRIQKFTFNGEFVAKWGGSPSDADGQFHSPEGVATDSSDSVYVADTYNHRIQKFTPNGEFVTKWGSLGSNAGEFSFPGGIAVNPDGTVYVSDTGNNRIQVFKKTSSVPSGKAMKAILVAGSGPYKGNNLWDATEMNANFAYRALTYQGYTKDTVFYLSSDRNLDLNGDGIPDVDGDATNSNLQSAITQWAKDAESLVVYLTGHGGDGTFRMSETEVLKAEELALWLNELQRTMQGIVTIIYDACESGSFVSKLSPPSERQRITITSTSAGEPAYFLSQGALSFSYTFWSQIFGGAKIYDAYVMGKDVIGVALGTGKSQSPEIDDNGNGVGNEKADGDLAREKYIGKGFAIAGDIPYMSGISPDRVLNGESSATITVEIMSTGRITKVWAVVHSPDFTSTPDNPITDLPSFELAWNQQSGKYEGTYDGFIVVGTYTVTVYAMNEAMIISLPKTTTVEQTFGEAPIVLQSPLDGASFSACSLSSPLTFSWTGEGYKGYEVQFSLDQGFSSISVKVKASTTQVLLSSATWKKVLMIPGSSGGTVYWRVEGRKADGTAVHSGVRSFVVESAEAVGNPTLSPTSRSSLPTISWENNCGVKFKVWFGSDNIFTKKISYAFSVKNPNDNGGVFNKGLTSAQWKAIRKLVSDVTGSTIFWYVESWDGLGRYVKTDVMNFLLTN